MHDDGEVKSIKYFGVDVTPDEMRALNEIEAWDDETLRANQDCRSPHDQKKKTFDKDREAREVREAVAVAARAQRLAAVAPSALEKLVLAGARPYSIVVKMVSPAGATLSRLHGDVLIMPHEPVGGDEDGAEDGGGGGGGCGGAPAGARPAGGRFGIVEGTCLPFSFPSVREFSAL